MIVLGIINQTLIVNEISISLKESNLSIKNYCLIFIYIALAIAHATKTKTIVIAKGAKPSGFASLKMRMDAI